MHYLALACDYDGTLATHGQVDETTLAALKRLRDSGRHLFLVTGRQLDELKEIFPHLDLFERVVAENGALLYHPAQSEERLLGDRPPAAFVQALRDRGVDRLGVGQAIVATWKPHDITVYEVIHEMGLQLQVILNKDAVMILPINVNKETGLRAALQELDLSADTVVGVGDAENDADLLHLCGYGVAVANALPLLKEKADWVTTQARGAGVTELIDWLLASDS